MRSQSSKDCKESKGTFNSLLTWAIVELSLKLLYKAILALTHLNFHKCSKNCLGIPVSKVIGRSAYNGESHHDQSVC